MRAASSSMPGRAKTLAMEALLVKYGYVVLFGGIMLEGEAFLLAAAFLAHRGYFELPVVIAVAVVATMLGDQIYYRAARARGRAWVERRAGARARYAKLLRATARHGVWLLMASRWMFGLRMVIPAACGAVGMRPSVFTSVDFLAVLVWALVLGLLGYRGGAAVEPHFREFRQAGTWVVLAVVLSVAAILGARRVQRQGRLRELGWSDLHAVVPFVMGLIGLFNIVSALWPRSAESLATVGRWLPLDVQGNRLVVLFAGVALLQVTRNLARRKELAWWVATAALALSLVGHLTAGVEPEHWLVAAFLLAYMLAFRRRFTAQTDPVTVQLALTMTPIIAVAILGYGAFGFRALERQFAWPPGVTPVSEAFWTGLVIAHPHVLAHGPQAERFLVSLQVAGWVARLYVLVLLLQPVILRVRQAAPPEVLEALSEGWARDALAAFALQDDKHHLLVAGGSTLVAYAVRNAVAVACGDPVGPPAARGPGAREFVVHCRRRGWTPCFFATGAATAAEYAAAGLKSLEVAEEAAVALSGPSGAAGPGMPGGLAVRVYDREAEVDTVLDEQILEVSDEWLSARKVEEYHFTVGALDLEDLGGRPVFVLLGAARVEAFCAWIRYEGGRGAALDLLRSREDAPEGARAALLAGALDALRERGVEQAALGLRLLPAPAANGRPEPGLAHVAERVRPSWTADDLAALDAAFPIAWAPRRLVYASDRDLVRIGVALAEVHTTLHEGHLVPRLAAIAKGLARRLRSDEPPR